MIKKIRIGVLGCANIAKRSVMPALLELPEFELVAVSSRTKTKAIEYADLFKCEAIEGYENIINRNDIEALYVPLPTGLHEEWIIKALESNKHVLTEKSLAMDLTSANKMIALAKSKKKILMEDFMFRYHSQHQFVFNQLEMKAIGELRLMRAFFGFPPLDKGNFRYNKELGGGALLDAAAYTVNASRWFLGNDIEINGANLFFDKQNDICLYGSAVLFSPNTGLTSLIGFGFDNFYQCNYELLGTKGIINCERAYTAPPLFEPIVKVSNKNGIVDFKLSPDNHFKNILSEFGNCISNENVNKHLDDLFNQSRLLTEIERKAFKFFI
jgi:NDP-hexose-3-ketoreductase